MSLRLEISFAKDVFLIIIILPGCYYIFFSLNSLCNVWMEILQSTVITEKVLLIDYTLYALAVTLHGL